ncbi:MAG: hypothetical protein KDK78_03025 [Chlamydiia bacterium]|nr:hypothetical protein [Chlamydiia bacterium]
MRTLVLENKASNGDLLQATFLPDHGMNLCSYKRGDVEVIDQSTRPLFEERFAGLGALIGPHFHRRHTAVLPKIENEARYPHIARVRANRVDDPFSHGIARYAPWQAERDGTHIRAKLTGKDPWEGTPIKDLEGQDFVMEMKADLEPDGLRIRLSVVSDTDSLVGIHYYYALPPGKATVKADVQPRYRIGAEWQALPQHYALDTQCTLTFDLKEEADFGFQPYKDPFGGAIVLETEKYTLTTRYKAPSQENTWQLYHPAGSSFVCIEPISAQNPKRPLLSVSSLDIKLSID